MSDYDEGYRDALADRWKRKYTEHYSEGWDAGVAARRQREHEREESEKRERERDENEERHQEEMLRALESQSEDEDRRQQEMLEALEAETESRRADVANAWQLQAESKANSASELYEAGLFDEALRLALEAIGESGRGDPTNIRGHMVAASCLQKLSRSSEAHKYYSSQVSLLKTSSYRQHPALFLEVLKSLPTDNALLSSFSTILEEAALKWDQPTDYTATGIELRTNASGLVDALMNRRLSDSARKFMATLIQKADSPASYYYPLLDTLLKNGLFHDAQLLVANLMGRGNCLELQAYWLEVSARGGGPVNDRFSAFLDDIHHDKAPELVNTFNAIAKGGKFSDRTITWLKDRITGRYEYWAAEQSAENERSRQLAPQTQPWTPSTQQRKRVWPWALAGVALICLTGIAVMIIALASLSKRSNNSTSNPTPRNSNLKESNTTASSAQPVGIAGKVLFSSQGGWRAINMTNGLRGDSAAGTGFYYGYFEYINFADSFQGRTLDVEVKSQYLPTKIELWRDNIPGDDHAWWSHYEQVATSSDKFEHKPQLRWTITPGSYTLFFSTFSDSGRISNVPFYAKLDIGPAEVQEVRPQDEIDQRERGLTREGGAQSPSPSDQTSSTPLSAGILNGKAISLPQPVYPALARQQRVSGQVTVQVTIDESGTVVSARAVSGPMLLRSAAVSAAKQAKFTPTMLSGQPVRVEGVINYNFVLD